MNERTLWGGAVLITLLFLSIPRAHGTQSVIYSRHNLSVTGPGSVKATSIDQPVCTFCHTPHREGQGQPLWQAMSRIVYTTYDSSTLKAEVGQPTGVSRLCLWRAMMGRLLSACNRAGMYRLSFRGGTTRMPSGPSNLGLDLSDDHPISFVYDSSLAGRNGQLAYPSVLRGTPVQLDKTGQLQCTSCHDAHDDSVWQVFSYG